MKKLTLLMLTIALVVIVTNSFAVQRSEVLEHWQWAERKDGVVVEDGNMKKTTSVTIPDPGATKQEVRTIVREENRKLLGVKYIQTATAIDKLGEKVDKITSKDGAFDKLGKKIDANIENTGGKINRNTWILAGCLALAVIAIIVVIVLTARRSRSHASKLQQEVTTLVEEVGKKVDTVPTKTAEEMGKPKVAVLHFDVKDNNQMEYSVSLKVERTDEGEYPSLFVPEDADFEKDPSKIERKMYTKIGDARDSSKGVMKKFFRGEYKDKNDANSQMTLILIAYLKGEKVLDWAVKK